jgi:NAD(P)-dependent dehydrogenase (short-subunit alcohol dehydrogenase family)
VEGLTKTLACEWGPQAINVNAIAPTVFRSELTAWMYEEEGRGKTVREAILARIPLGRLGEPADFAGAVIFLCSRASDFVTGQILYVDGGYTAG